MKKKAYKIPPFSHNKNVRHVKGGIEMSVLNNWQEWKDFLGNRLDKAQESGMQNEKVTDIAYHVGDFLANKVDPKNEQQRVLSDLWSVATPEEQHTLANMMVKLVGNDGKN